MQLNSLIVVFIAMETFLLFLGAAVSAIAVPTHNYELHERIQPMPTSWIQGKRLDSAISLPVRIGLTQSNLDLGHSLLMEM